MSNIDLRQGDCLAEMDKLIERGVKVDMILTDPPYGTTACKWDSVIPFEPMWAELKRIIKPNGAIVLFGGEPFSSALRMSNIKNYKYDWIWVKSPTGFLNAKKMPMKSVENITIFYRKLPTYNPQGIIKIKDKTIRNHSTKINRTSVGLSTHNGGRLGNSYTQSFTGYPAQTLMFSNEKGYHPTQKPVALLEYLIRTYTLDGETVLDFTMGSFSTAIACLNTKRSFIGIEKDAHYFQVGKDRLEKHLLTLDYKPKVVYN